MFLQMYPQSILQWVTLLWHTLWIHSGTCWRWKCMQSTHYLNGWSINMVNVNHSYSIFKVDTPIHNILVQNSAMINDFVANLQITQKTSACNDKCKKGILTYHCLKVTLIEAVYIVLRYIQKQSIHATEVNRNAVQFRLYNVN